MSLQKLIKYTNDNGLAPVDVEAIKAWFIGNGYQDEINFIPTPFEEDKLRGMFRKHEYSPGPYKDNVWVTDILYAETLNNCWKRFVCTKEMLHLFDKNTSATFTIEALDKLTANLTDPMLRLNPSAEATVDHSRQVHALAVLAPIDAVENLKKSYEEGRRSDLDIAKIFMIPQYYIPLLMNPEFSSIRNYLQ